MSAARRTPTFPAIIDLAPDLVVLDRQENRREDAEALATAGLRLLALDVRSLDRMSDELAKVAAAVGATYRPAPLPELAPLGLRAFVPIWRRPWITIGGDTYGSTLLSAIGVANVFADASDDYPQIALDEVAERQPDVVLVPSEPYQFTDHHLTELDTIAPAIRVDGQDLFWWGARTPDALTRLHAHLAGP